MNKAVFVGNGYLALQQGARRHRERWAEDERLSPAIAVRVPRVTNRDSLG